MAVQTVQSASILKRRYFQSGPRGQQGFNVFIVFNTTNMEHSATRQTPASQTAPHELAEEMAKQLCIGFQAHDHGSRDRAIEAFSFVDRHQFPHLAAEKARAAARAYVDALFRKNEVEFQELAAGGIDATAIAETDWSPVAAKFRERAAIVGMEPDYARLSTTAWRRHKADGDYWTPMQAAQVHELRVALDDPTYPNKPKYGQAGYGPEAARYTLGVELHDMHTEEHWNQAREVMVPYYRRILAAHQ
jgi:hypothetical protein